MELVTRKSMIGPGALAFTLNVAGLHNVKNALAAAACALAAGVSIEYIAQGLSGQIKPFQLIGRPTATYQRRAVPIRVNAVLVHLAQVVAAALCAIHHLMFWVVANEHALGAVSLQAVGRGRRSQTR